MSDTYPIGSEDQSMQAMMAQLIQMVAKNNELVLQLRDDFEQFRGEMYDFRTEMYDFRDEANGKLDHIARRLEIHRNMIGKNSEEIELIKLKQDQ